MNQVRQKNNIDADKYKKEIKVYIEKINLMNNQIQKLTIANNNLNKQIQSHNIQNNSNTNIISLYQRIEELNKRIEDLNEQIKRYPFALEKDEKMLSVIFASSSFNYSMICKNTDTINKLEGELYQIYPELAETNNYFLYKGEVASRIKKLKDLGVKNGEIISINQHEE